MPLLGKGAITIWQDARPEARAEFFEWHNREHVPERVGIAGFLRARRWAAIDGTPEFFTLYETSSPQVHTSAGYLERLNNPSPWTRRFAPNMVNNIRSLCRVAFSAGRGQGGLLVTLRYDVAPESEQAQLRLLTEQILPKLVESPGITGAHLCLADKAASSIQTEEKKSRPQAALVPTWVILVEGAADSASLVTACDAALVDDVLAAAGAQGIARGLYRLQYGYNEAA
jgi:hypothetical protein